MITLNVGDDAPLFSLPSSLGKPIDLTEQRGKWVVLYFYPKDDTSGCTKEACGFRDLKKEYDKLGALIFGVSADDMASHESFVKKNKLNFPLLSDTKQTILDEYGVLEEKVFLGKKKTSISRTTFVIDAEGRIAKIYTNVKPETHHDEVLEYLKTVNQWTV